MELSRSKLWKANAPVILVLLAICLLVLPAIAFYPFHPDIDIQQIMGFQLYRYHAMPYLGSWDENFPGTILIHATAIALMGNSELSLRIMDILFQCGVVIVLYKLGRLWMDRDPALLGSAVYAIYYIHGPGQYMSQRDCFAVLPIVLAIYTTVRAFRSVNISSSNYWAAASGLFAGWAFWIRPTFGILIATSLFLFASRERVRLLMLQWGTFIVVCAICLLPYALVPGGINELYLATIRFNNDIYRHHFDLQRASPRIWLSALFIACWGFSMWWNRRRGHHGLYRPSSKRERQYLIGTMGGLLFGVLLMGRMASYHFAPFMACCMPILAAIAWSTLQTFPARTWIVAGGIVVAFFSLYPWELAQRFAAHCQSYAELTQHFDKSFNAGTNRTLIRYIEQQSHPNDSIEIISSDAALRWRIDRPSATRFTTMQPLIILAPDSQPTDYQLAWRKEYLHAISTQKMKFFAIEKVPDAPVSLMRQIMALPNLEQTIDRYYHRDTSIGDYSIYTPRNELPD